VKKNHNPLVIDQEVPVTSLVTSNTLITCGHCSRRDEFYYRQMGDTGIVLALCPDCERLIAAPKRHAFANVWLFDLV